LDCVKEDIGSQKSMGEGKKQAIERGAYSCRLGVDKWRLKRIISSPEVLADSKVKVRIDVCMHPEKEEVKEEPYYGEDACDLHKYLCIHNVAYLILFMLSQRPV